MKLSELKNSYADLDRYIDVADGLNRIRSNKKVYSMILKTFLQDTHCAGLRGQLTDGNYLEAQKTAHAVKGLAANLSLPLAREAAADMEARLKTGDTDLLPALEELEEIMKKKVEYIELVLQNLEEIEV
jgi:HPt (histidine-containing phosphotransfer) domain-containing protein